MLILKLIHTAHVTEESWWVEGAKDTNAVYSYRDSSPKYENPVKIAEMSRSRIRRGTPQNEELLNKVILFVSFAHKVFS